MSQSSNQPGGGPPTAHRYLRINHRIYRIPAPPQLPGASEPQQYRLRIVRVRNGVRRAYLYRTRRGTSEAVNGSRRYRSGTRVSSRGPRDRAMRTDEQSPKKDADKVKEKPLGSFRLNVGDLPVQGPNEYEAACPPNLRGQDDLDREALRSQNRSSRHPREDITNWYDDSDIHWIRRYNRVLAPRPYFIDDPVSQNHPARRARRAAHARRQVQRGLDWEWDGQKASPLPLFQSPSSRTSLPVRSRRLSQHNNGHGRPHENFDPSGFEDKWRRYNAWDNRTETQPASVPSDAELDIKISYQDSSEDTQTKDDAHGTALEPLMGYAIAN